MCVVKFPDKLSVFLHLICNLPAQRFVWLLASTTLHNICVLLIAHPLQVSQKQFATLVAESCHFHDGFKILLHAEFEVNEVWMPFRVGHSTFLVEVELKPVMALDGAPANALLGLLGIKRVDFVKE